MGLWVSSSIHSNDEAVRQALAMLREGSGWDLRQRLRALLPVLSDSMERTAAEAGTGAEKRAFGRRRSYYLPAPAPGTGSNRTTAGESAQRSSRACW